MDTISALENKNHWSKADYAAFDKLQTDLSKAIAHESAADEYAEKRDLINEAGGRFCSVTFIKANGDERTMKVQPAALKFHVKGDDASEVAQKATEARKARHPHLMPVWDVDAKAVRSVNLATIQTIAVDGMAHAYGG